MALDHTLTAADQEQLKTESTRLQLDKARLETLVALLNDSVSDDGKNQYFTNRLLVDNTHKTIDIHNNDIFLHQQQLDQQWLIYLSQKQALVEKYKEYQA